MAQRGPDGSARGLRARQRRGEMMAGKRAGVRENGSGRLTDQFRDFFHNEASSGILLLLMAVVALIWANSPWSGSYFGLWSTKLTVGTEAYNISKPLTLWVNDALMAIFFFVVGLEIKRELLVGELASVRRAALPAAAALGGAVVPALIYLALNRGGPGASGWGVPMATDIAFALGVLALLGSRVPASLKILLAALAIVDDLLAVLVIAIFYTSSIRMDALIAAAMFLVALVAANRFGVRTVMVYALLGVGLWVGVLKSGVHATIAGVLLAITIPATTKIDQIAFVDRARLIVDRFAASARYGTTLPTPDQEDALSDLEDAADAVQSPLQKLEHSLHPVVAFFIMPIFALANAGVALGGDMGEVVTSPVTIGVVLGLILGKQVGITAAAWLATRSGVATLPEGVAMRHVYGMSWLGAIGFTMSLFIANLAFPGNEALLTAGKIGILAASTVAGVVGFIFLRRIGLRAVAEEPVRTLVAARE
jgi:Na+:H+ antiporter, NhaA family